MCDDHYYPHEFNYIIYQASSGGISCPDSDARISWYGITGFPTLKFDGNWYTEVGAGPGVVDGVHYMDKIDERRETTSPMAVAITSFNLSGGSPYVEAKVTLHDDFDPTNHKIRIAIVENDLAYGSTVYQGTCRDILPDQNLTISANGEEQIVNLPITVGSWNLSNVVLIAFVQNDTNKYVENSGNSLVVDYASAVTVDGSQQMIATGGQLAFGNTNLTNVGLMSDTYDISLDTSSLPTGWDAHLSFEGSDYTDFSVPVSSFETTMFNVVMDDGAGSGRVFVDVYSQGLAAVTTTLEYVAVDGGADFLLVSDDSGAGLGESVYGPAIVTAGKSYAEWTHGLGTLAAADLLGFDAVIWQTGSNSEVLLADDRATLDGYLGGGGLLVLAGEDILESMVASGGALWYQLKLRINYVGPDSGDLVVNGVAGNAIGDGLSFTLTGGDPDQLRLVNNQPVETAFEFGNGEPAGVQTTYGGYKVVTLPFGLERVPTQDDADAILFNSLTWLGVMGSSAVGDLPTATVALGQNAPNPFNPSTKIAFNLDNDGPARLEIFNTRGQLVRVLSDGPLAAGQHVLTWNGRTDGGRQAASGTYFYRLTFGDQRVTKKMSLVK